MKSEVSVRVYPIGLRVPFSMLTVQQLCALHWNDVFVDGDRNAVIIKT